MCARGSSPFPIFDGDPRPAPTFVAPVRDIWWARIADPRVDISPRAEKTTAQMNTISPEFIAIIGAAIALAAVILPGQYAMRRDIVDLRERMTKLEGSVDVLSNLLIDRERRRGGREATT